MTIYLLVITLILQPGAMVWDFQDNRFKPLQLEVRQEFGLVLHSPLEARSRYEEMKARWRTIWPELGTDAELYIVDRKAGVLLRVPLPVEAAAPGP